MSTLPVDTGYMMNRATRQDCDMKKRRLPWDAAFGHARYFRISFDIAAASSIDVKVASACGLRMSASSIYGSSLPG